MHNTSGANLLAVLDFLLFIWDIKCYVSCWYHRETLLAQLQQEKQEKFNSLRYNSFCCQFLKTEEWEILFSHANLSGIQD